MSIKTKALFICSHIPSRNAHQAGHKTAFHHLSELSENYFVDLIIVSKAKDLPLDADVYLALKEIVDDVSIFSLSNLDRLCSFFLGFSLGLSPRFSSRINIKLLLKLRKIRSQSVYEKIWLEFSQTFWTALFLGGYKETVMSAHDIQTQVVSRKSLIESILSLGWTYWSEARLLSSATKIRVLSNKDADYIRGFLGINVDIEVSNPVLSDFIYSIERLDAKIEPYSMLFWGAMSREENSGAIINFISTYFAGLKKEYPTLKLYVVGSGPTSEIYQLAKKWKDSIIITGFVDNPSVYFERCSLGIAPLMAGAGIKLKVLEMLEAKIPVLSTPVGSEGIKKNCLLHTVPIELFEEKIKLLWG